MTTVRKYPDVVEPVAVRYGARVVKFGVTAGREPRKNNEIDAENANFDPTAMGWLEDIQNF